MDPMVAALQRIIRQPRSMLAVAILIITVVFGFSSGHLPISPAAHADAQRVVSLYADGQTKVFTTDATTVGDVLTRDGVTLAPGDLVEPSASTPVPTGFFNINIYRARPVVVVDGAHSYNIQSAYQNPNLLAKAAGLTLYPEDTLSTQVITNFVATDSIGIEVTVTRAIPFSVHVDGQTLALRTQAHSVADALAAGGVKLGLKDTTSVAPTAPVTTGLDVTVTRVSDVNTQITDVLPRPVQTVIDPDMAKGTSVVKAAGSDGAKTAVYTIHYRNGVEVSRDLVQLISQITPTPQVIIVGTKVFFAGSVEYWRPLVEAAAAQYGFDPNTMLRIMACESGGNATTVSHFIVDGQHPTGLFQYLPSTWLAAGGTNENILDGPTQITLTARKMALYGTSAWQCK